MKHPTLAALCAVAALALTVPLAACDDAGDTTPGTTRLYDATPTTLSPAPMPGRTQ